MTKCIAFHSYKGGTGKTTLAANFAALLAKKGYRVFLLDLDVYAPSLQSYFQADPKKWINDFLFENAELKEVVLDFTPLIQNHGGGSISNTKGKTKCGQLWVGFCNSKKDEIYKMEGSSQLTRRQDTSKKHLFRRFVLLREMLLSEYQVDYIIIDTSSGIRYWSINALVVADALLLTLKMADLDIVGTREIVEEIYGSFTKFGTKSFLLCNRVSGYCVPHNVLNDMKLHSRATAKSPLMNQQVNETNMENFLVNETGMEVISTIPCYCDIQFTRKEFLTVLYQPEHPFAKQFEHLVHAVETL
ncbi:MAG TPA: AAA family ATPase [Candidatus Bathyarchaeia archaeon]|nr:AAA family ATPase [Candidatus Bathyarchaeia archaeon]